MNIYRKDGNLSAYGYSCGYITRKTKLTKEVNARLLTKELFKEHGLYRVRQFDDAKNIFDESFYKLHDAEKKYNSLKLTA